MRTKIVIKELKRLTILLASVRLSFEGDGVSFLRSNDNYGTEIYISRSSVLLDVLLVCVNDVI